MPYAVVALCYTQSQVLDSRLSSYFIAHFSPNRWGKDQARRKNLTTFK